MNRYKDFRRRPVGLAWSMAMLGLGGCSVYMHAQRPDPVDLAQFPPGMSRMQVISKLGTPVASVTQDGQACDIFRVYLGQHGTAGKAAVMVLEGAAAVFTLGLSEVLLAPAEALTKSELTPVAFCYEEGTRLASVTVVQAPAVTGEAPATTTTAAAGPATASGSAAGARPHP